MEEEDRKAQMKRDNRFDIDYDRRLHPKRRADFDRLFNALEQWRKEEVHKIYDTANSPADRKANMGLLIDREIELIAAIVATRLNFQNMAGCDKWSTCSRQQLRVTVGLPYTIKDP